MLRIRLSRTGKKKQASYRVVVADSQAKRDGRVVERIGHYNPRMDPADYLIDEGRALYWLSVGAQPSEAVNRLLVKQGTIDRLGRLRQGESLDSLVAEFSGVEVVEEKATEPESVVAAIIPDVVEDVVEDVVAAVEEKAAEPESVVAAIIPDVVEDVVEDVVAAVEEIITDEEE